jgi:protocatechuate 3,4-dioxygenase beta subunit
MDGCFRDDTITEGASRADGTYRVYVQQGGYKVTVTNGAEMAVIDHVDVAKDEAKSLDIHLSPATVFRAKVVDSVTGAPVEGVRLYNWRLKEFEGTSNDRGELAIPGLPNGKFKFSVDGEKRDITRWWSGEAAETWQRYTIDEPKTKWQRNFDDLTFNMELGMAPVTVTVERGVHVRGTVLDPDGMPVEGATVAPARTGTSNSLTGDTRFSVRTGRDGEFGLLLPASKDSVYNLICHDGDYQEWRTWANGGMEPMTTQPGDVKEGVVLHLQRPCIVRGRVMDAAGKPMAEHAVRACAADRKDHRYYVPEAKTDSGGNFELKYVAPGKHFVQAAPYWLNPEEAPVGSSRVVETAAEKPVEGVELTGAPNT